MNKKSIAIIVCLATIFLAACSPSPRAIQTAIAQTQAANPTSTFTLVPPTDTPTATSSETPTVTLTTSPTPDLLLLQLNLKDFLLQQSDFPPHANYSSIYNSLKHLHNEDVDNPLVKETGRLDGWSVWYGKDYSGGGWPVVLSNEVSLYQTTGGAQIAVAKYSRSGFTEEINPPEIGDSTRAFYATAGSSSQADYVIIFSYRNCVHIVDEFGYENEVAVIVRKIALILLAKLQASPLINP
jgi:hypothetical protein